MIIKVLIADEKASVRRLEKIVLESENEIEVVGEAGDMPETIRLTDELKPDVIVMDLNTPGDGFRATRLVKALRPQVKFLATTADPELYGPEAVGELGADAFLPKTAIGKELIPTIKRLARITA